MGMLDKWFGGKHDYPTLPADNQAQAALEEVKSELEGLAGKVSDHLEVVPGNHEAFVYLGHPPKRFGIAWIHDGKISGLNELIEQNNLTPQQANRLISDLGEAYRHAADAERYSMEFAGKAVVVIPSEGLGREAHQIIENAIH